MAKLLLVDDDADSVDALCRYLQDMCGYEVERIDNGRMALQTILHCAPDLIILDLHMPELDGCTLLEVLRSYLRLQSLPVIVLTGLPDSPRLDRARQLNANRIFEKGKAELKEIAKAVREELRRRAGKGDL